MKRLAGGAATGRKLEKPVCHYSLNWAKDEKPDRQEMLRVAEGSLKALGMERHQALIVSHRDGQPHVHVIANRVEPGERQGGGVEPEQAKTLEVGGRIRAGAGGRSGARRGRGTMRGGGKGNGFRIGSRARQGGTGGRR